MSSFPKVLVTVETKKKFYSFREIAMMLQGSWFQYVYVGDLILNEDFSVRNIKMQEIDQINEMCDEYSASK